MNALGSKGNADVMENKSVAIETNITDADRLFNRMNSMIRSSQQIYVFGQDDLTS